MPIQPKQQPPYYTPTTFKIYEAFLNQEGETAPTDIKLNDTIQPTLTRNSAGSYRITKANTFPRDKTAIILGTQVDDGTAVFSEWNDINSIDITTTSGGSNEDDLLIYQYIMIIVYP